MALWMFYNSCKGPMHHWMRLTILTHCPSASVTPTWLTPTSLARRALAMSFSLAAYISASLSFPFLCFEEALWLDITVSFRLSSPQQLVQKSLLRETVKHLCENSFTLWLGGMLFGSLGALPLALCMPFRGGFKCTLRLQQSGDCVRPFSQSSIEGVILVVGG